MSQWEMVNGKSVETGLSPGQTSGDVGGVHIERPDYSDPSKAYRVGSEPVVGKQQMGYQSKTQIAGASRSGNIGERLIEKGGWLAGLCVILTSFGVVYSLFKERG